MLQVRPYGVMQVINDLHSYTIVGAVPFPATARHHRGVVALRPERRAIRSEQQLYNGAAETVTEAWLCTTALMNTGSVRTWGHRLISANNIPGNFLVLEKAASCMTTGDIRGLEICGVGVLG